MVTTRKKSENPSSNNNPPPDRSDFETCVEETEREDISSADETMEQSMEECSYSQKKKGTKTPLHIKKSMKQGMKQMIAALSTSAHITLAEKKEMIKFLEFATTEADQLEEKNRSLSREITHLNNVIKRLEKSSQKNIKKSFSEVTASANTSNKGSATTEQRNLEDKGKKNHQTPNATIEAFQINRKTQEPAGNTDITINVDETADKKNVNNGTQLADKKKNNKNTQTEKDKVKEIEIQEKINIQTDNDRDNGEGTTIIKNGAQQNGEWKTARKSRKRKDKKTEHILVIELDKQAKGKARDVFNAVVDPKKLKLKIDGVHNGRNNKLIVCAKDKEQLKKLGEEIKKEGKHLLCRDPKPKAYRLAIKKLPLKEKKDYRNVVECIREQNEEIRIEQDGLIPLFCKKDGKNTYTVVMSADKKTRDNLNEKKLYIQYGRYTVSEYYAPIICARCSKYGHPMKECRTELKNITCTKCSKTGHERINCKEEIDNAKPCCPACIDTNTRRKTDKKIDSNHWPGSKKCTIFNKMAEKEKGSLSNTK